LNALFFPLYAVVLAALVCAHFVPAYRAWRDSRGEQPSDIDPDYVRLEDYFARSFRLKVSEWIKLPVQAAMPDGTCVLVKGREQVKVSPAAQYPPRSRSDEILVVQGAFECSAGCIFNREIYVRRDARIGPGSRLQSIAVDGDLSLGAGVQITRWVDAAGTLEIGPDSVVRSRATAGRLVRLAKGVRVASVFAPTVTTAAAMDGNGEKPAGRPTPEIEIPGAVAARGGDGGAAKAGMEAASFRWLSPDCGIYDGDLMPSAPVRVACKLVVKSDLVLPAGSILEGDVKAHGRIVVGEGAVCRGNVVAGGDISFGPFSRFHGVVHAGGTVRLGRRVCGGSEDVKVAVYATDTLVLEEDVIVHGKVASADCVVVPASPKRGSHSGRKSLS